MKYASVLTHTLHSILLELSCDQVSMETKRVILARFVDFDVTPTNVLPWQQDVRFSEKFYFC